MREGKRNNVYKKNQRRGLDDAFNQFSFYMRSCVFVCVGGSDMVRGDILGKDKTSDNVVFGYYRIAIYG